MTTVHCGICNAPTGSANLKPNATKADRLNSKYIHGDPGSSAVNQVFSKSGLPFLSNAHQAQCPMLCAPLRIDAFFSRKTIGIQAKDTSAI
jgi:hypothetical protein